MSSVDDRKPEQLQRAGGRGNSGRRIHHPACHDDANGQLAIEMDGASKVTRPVYHLTPA